MLSRYDLTTEQHKRSNIMTIFLREGCQNRTHDQRICEICIISMTCKEGNITKTRICENTDTHFTPNHTVILIKKTIS